MAPIRLCLGCGERDRQDHLVRFSLRGDGALVLGPGPGRGGYLHRRPECLRSFASARGGMVRSLRVVLSRETRAEYAAAIEQYATR